MPNTPDDITNELATVHGGRGAARAALNLARRGGDALEKIGGYASGVAVLKEGWDWLRGNNQSQPQSQPAQPPSQPAAKPE